ncbi:MAG: mechanosensitive ion channel family protein [Myxococcota bacterium]
MHARLCAFVASLTLIIASPAWAQTRPSADAVDVQPVSPATDTEGSVDTSAAPPSPNAWSPAALEAFEVWSEAFNRTPKLVSLGSLDVQAQGDEGLEKSLRARLALLGRKKVSNRQWQDYWAKQKSLSVTLSKALTGAEQSLIREGLGAWSTLANDKVANQDIYLQAIENERDAIEERLEATLATGVGESAAAQPAPKLALGANASPFEARRQRIAELTYRIHQQDDKLAATEIAKVHSQRQTATQDIMGKALATDLALAKRERRIAQVQATIGPKTWRTLWTGELAGADDKVASIADEVALGEQRVRSLEVELSLLNSQISYRTKKASELSASLAESSSTSGWFVAIYETAFAWAVVDGWQVVLMLLLLWMAVKIALRLIDAFTRTLLKAVEDDDQDNISQEEARAQTIASVFRSVARVGVMVIGVLMALEMIGVNTGPILGSVAILGLAISFGSQSLVKDIVTGFFILLENQFAVGETVTISGTTGTVEGISLRVTLLRQANGTLNVIPNGQISTVANVSRDWSKATVHVGIAYGSDLREVERIVNSVGESLFTDQDHSEKFEEVPTFIGVTALGDSAVTVRVQAKVKACAHWGIERELNRRLLEALTAGGIDIPFPQQVVWHQNQA